MKDRNPAGSSRSPGQRWNLRTNRENLARQTGLGSQTSTWCPANPRIVIASRDEVLFPSETSTRSGFGACAGVAMPDIIAGFGAVREGCHAAMFMDK